MNTEPLHCGCCRSNDLANIFATPFLGAKNTYLQPTPCKKQYTTAAQQQQKKKKHFLVNHKLRHTTACNGFVGMVYAIIVATTGNISPCSKDVVLPRQMQHVQKATLWTIAPSRNRWLCWLLPAANITIKPSSFRSATNNNSDNSYSNNTTIQH